VAHILLIEDDPDLGARLKQNIELEGYRVSWAADGRRGLAAAQTAAPDLIILDLMLPLLDGLHILKTLRRDLDPVPVMILTAKGRETQRLDGFRAGCDDYLVKPFSLVELLARIRAVLRRSGHRDAPSILHSGGFTLDPAARTLTRCDRPIALTPKELDLLYTLMAHPNQALSRSSLLEEVWGCESDVTDRTVDSHIASLRKKLEVNPEAPAFLHTVYKVGYRWSAGDAPPGPA
jgi:two-component system, OmpR family, alkaline phosphatase synthesis response regulator PhoP